MASVKTSNALANRVPLLASTAATTLAASSPRTRASATLMDDHEVGGLAQLQTSPQKLLELKRRCQMNHDGDVKIKFLCGETTINVRSANITTVHELKEYLCDGTGGMCPEDVMVVYKGSELADSWALNSNGYHFDGHMYAMVRSKAKNQVTIPVSCRANGKSSNTQIKISCAARTFYLSEQLYKQKLVPLRASSQRLMMGTRQLSDERAYIGNFILAAAATQHKRRKQVTACPTLHVTQTVDTKYEVDVQFVLGQTKKSIKFPFEIGVSLEKIQDILVRSYFCPRGLGKLDYFLVPDQVSDVTVLSDNEILMDRSKTLLDYGITSATKSVKIRGCIIHDVSLAPPPRDVFVDLPSLITFLGNLHAVTQSFSGASTPTTPSTPTVEDSKPTVTQLPVPVPDPVRTVVAAKPAPATTMPAAAAHAETTPTTVNAKKRPVPVAADKTTKDMFRGMKKGFLFSSADKNKDGSKASKIPKH
jgi:hypothetical protein